MVSKLDWPARGHSHTTSLRIFPSLFLGDFAAIKERGHPKMCHSNRSFSFRKCTTPMDEGNEEQYGVPSLEDLGIEVDYEVLWPGGESHGLKRLEKHLESQVHHEACGVGSQCA